MKKFFIVILLALLFSLTACANQSEKFSAEMLPNDIVRISVSHSRSNQVIKWSIYGDEIEEWEKWLDKLSARKKNFEEGNTPGDVNGGEVYSFVINDEEASISYVINGVDDCYIFYENEWYAVSKPSNPYEDYNMSDTKDEKPVIYLYPEESLVVRVELVYNGNLICTYPAYNEGWTVTAHPDGRLIDQTDGREYTYLFWEGTSNIEYDMSKGFVVKGEDTADFLRDKLEYIGLTPKEYNEFIVYWLPKMQNNQFNLITFQNEAYTDNAELKIMPEPDSILRVFMAYRPLDEAITIEEQNLEPFSRQGFSVIEWGGAVVK